MSAVNKALAEDSAWTQNAVDINRKIRQRFKNRNDEDLSGTSYNAKVVSEMLAKSISYKYEPPERFLLSTINNLSSFRVTTS